MKDGPVYKISHYYAPPHMRGHKAMMLSDVYIGPKSRTERPRKTKIHRGSPRHTWLGHHFQGQKVKVIGGAYCGGLQPTGCFVLLWEWDWRKEGAVRFVTGSTATATLNCIFVSAFLSHLHGSSAISVSVESSWTPSAPSHAAVYHC